ncbi:halocarboxylic acid dehydrogenase DehI family protein [Radiobacillus kanasensis]|uniref:halocarboxylic acid dehydrogenase DehI family protein n=1 Tax=Radiobacillus kanasensis TaxID=2844358 RepID=UPI001E5DA3D0|nr:halocarboxylic acid dehydrogenase DehI family protein [Radiobacillus kanasensis]UFT99384.1 halocarboxylic acid dehydrogenase DehI family protein [Radiobacillus kanasensis]
MRTHIIPEVLESEATGRTKELYEDIKEVLQVPVVNFVFRALAHYPTFLEIAWEQVRPNMLTLNMDKTASHLQYPGISNIIPLLPWQTQYPPHVLNQLQGTLDIFRYVNPKLLLITSAWTEALSNRPVKGKGEVLGFLEPGIDPAFPRIDLLHPVEADPTMKKLLFEIAEAHQAMDVASDFRALAHYPDFLKRIWSYLKPFVKSSNYTLLESQLSKKAVRAVHRDMPYPVVINRDQLARVYSPKDIAGIMGLVSLFHRFLPGLIIDCEFMHRTFVNS